MLQHPLTQYLCRVCKDPRVHLHHCKGLLLIDIQKLLQPEPALSGVSTYLFTKHIQTPRSVRSDICSKKTCHRLTALYCWTLDTLHWELALPRVSTYLLIKHNQTPRSAVWHLTHKTSRSRTTYCSTLNISANSALPGGNTCAGGFFPACKDSERMFNHSFSACIFFFFFGSGD